MAKPKGCREMQWKQLRARAAALRIHHKPLPQDTVVTLSQKHSDLCTFTASVCRWVKTSLHKKTCIITQFILASLIKKFLN